MSAPVTTIDDSWYRSITSFAQHTAWLHKPMEIYTTASVVGLAVIALGVWWAARARSDRRAMAAVIWLGLGTVVAIGASYVLKDIFQEIRPCRAMHVAVVEACPALNDYAFPSNHTTIAVAIAAGIWLINWRWGILAMAMTFLEGFSRVYLGQHYPHDVIAGLLVGGAIVFCGWPLVRGTLLRLVGGLERTPLRPLLSARRAG